MRAAENCSACRHAGRHGAARCLRSASLGAARRRDVRREARRRSFERSLEQRAQAWTLFGRLGVIHYQNQLDRDSGSGGEITLKRSGPSIGGARISIGLRRRF